ncbi:MAG: DUF2071 domain-containing protein, partial [Desulfuromonadales bacterium]|nr:DUF2071 domain-containing protein [Desulfuromonadales bacterium]
MIDRQTVRTPPAGWPILRQNWGRLLFLHWRWPPEQLRPLIPARLEIDTFDGDAWVAATPFSLWGISPPLLPAVPLLSRSLELNLRTYVHFDGVPGIWFFSLDASNPLVVLGARLGYRLPYFPARMRLNEADGLFRFTSHRLGAPAADFEASWRLGPALPAAAPDTLEFFLIERYVLYAAAGGRLYRARIHPPPGRFARPLSSVSPR